MFFIGFSSGIHRFFIGLSLNFTKTVHFVEEKYEIFISRYYLCTEGMGYSLSQHLLYY